MKKKLSLLVIFAFMLMGAAACKQPAGNEKTENTPGESEEIEVKNIEYGTEESLLEGKKLEQLTVTGTDDAFYCNLEENIKWFDLEAAPMLVCKDPVYDITYYINYGRDYYIYAYRNGVAELVVEIPAKDLFCKEGELYFIADTYGRYQFSDFAEGNVLKYNPKDGSVAVVVDCSADRMIVYQDGICYEQRGAVKQFGEQGSVAVKRFFFSFATGECSPLPKDSDNLRRWNGCWIDERYEVVEASEDFLAENEELMQEISELGYTFAGVSGSLKSINLVDIQGNVTETLQNVEGISKEYWISGDSAYYVEQRENDTDSRSVLRRYDRLTGMHEDVVVLDYPTTLSFDDMIFYNGVVYFENGLRVALESGAQCYMQNTEGTSVLLESFYTDGENLFCISGGQLWLFKEQPGVPISAVEFVSGVPLEMGTYVYSLCEP